MENHRRCCSCGCCAALQYRRDSRIGSLFWLLGVLGILILVFQEKVVLLPQARIFHGGQSPLVICSSDGLNSAAQGHPTATGNNIMVNRWGGYQPAVISSTNCTTMASASKKSLGPRDWLEMCMTNNDIYNHYMAPKSKKNYLTSLIPQVKEGNDNHTTPFGNSTNHGTTTSATARLSMLVIGDSLDRFMVQHICNVTQGKIIKVDPSRYSSRKPIVCSSPTLEIGNLNIFGMKRTCDNGGVAHHQDDRPFNSTVDRIKELLPDVLKKLDNRPQYVLISSALWDLSQGCVGRNGVPQSYRDEYSLGMREIYDYLISNQGATAAAASPVVGLAKDAEIYWRTSPPVRKSYSIEWALVSLVPFNVGGHGRTRRNQKILNQLMFQTFSEYHLGNGVADWWQIARGASEKFLNQELPDGRHYGFCSSLAFFNEWLDLIHSSSSSKVENWET